MDLRYATYEENCIRAIKKTSVERRKVLQLGKLLFAVSGLTAKKKKNV